MTSIDIKPEKVRFYDSGGKNCSPKPLLENRDLLNAEYAGRLQDIFKILANENRIRIIHAIVIHGEMNVNEIAECIGMKIQAVSNQLQKMVQRGILESRREGNFIFYSITDPCVIALIEHGLCLLEDSLRDEVFGPEK
jgi:DNA-binding transcriptional ArsR family regulator